MCLRTGEPTDDVVGVSWRVVPGWTYALLFFGILPFLVARWFAGYDVSGTVPISSRLHARPGTIRRARNVLLGVGIGLAAVGLLTQSLAVAMAGTLLVAGGAAAGLAGAALWVGALPGRGRGEVLLWRVSPHFVDLCGVDAS